MLPITSVMTVTSPLRSQLSLIFYEKKAKLSLLCDKILCYIKGVLCLRNMYSYVYGCNNKESIQT